MGQIKCHKTNEILYESKDNCLLTTLLSAIKYYAILENANLKGIDLERTVLSRANLQGANLQGANLKNSWLYRVNLKEANLKGVNLEGASLTEADLEGADLEGAHLKDVRFNNANLKGINFAEGKLEKVSFYKAKLRGANFTNIDLKDCDFNDADLKYAEFQIVNLDGTSLNGADLSGAKLDRINLEETNLNSVNFTQTQFIESNFYRARLNNTIFGLTNLTECLNLDTVVVTGECVIDFRTIINSPNLSHRFLHKLGISELALDYIPDLTNINPIKMFPVFLSHSWKNKAFARKLYEELSERGVHCWFDEKRMKPGDDIYEKISKGVNNFDKTILICSKESLKSWWVDKELNRVFSKERWYTKNKGKKVNLLIPITIDEYIYKWQGAKSEDILRYSIGNFKNWEDDQAFEIAFKNLISALLVDRPEIPPQTFI